MPRQICPELYPDPRPSRFLSPALPYVPRLVRLLPWLAATPLATILGLLMLATLPLVTWAVLCVAVLLPLAAGAMFFKVGWE
jgi:hypothetical protein